MKPTKSGFGLKLIAGIVLLGSLSIVGLLISAFQGEKDLNGKSGVVAESSQSSKPSLEINSPEIQARVLRGKQLFERLKPQMSDNPSVRGQLTAVPSLAFYLTNSSWNKLSKEQQIDLTWYCESFIPTAKSQPENYAGISPNAPFYPRAVQITRELCADCWGIVLGDPVIKDGQKTMTIDRVVVEGDTPWSKESYPGRTIKASEFRQQTKTNQ